MIALCWIVAGVFLGRLQFHRKRIADHLLSAHSSTEMVAIVLDMDKAGYDCFVRCTPVCWEVRCYRRKERNS